MFSRYITAIILIVLVFLLSGCAGQQEIDRVSYPTVLGIDYDEKNGTTKVYAQMPGIASLGGSSTGDGSQMHEFTVFEGEGNTLQDALNEISDNFYQSVSWKHVINIIIGGNIAKRGIRDELDFLCRFYNIRLNSYLMITEDDIKELLSLQARIHPSMPTSLGNVALIGEETSTVMVTTITDFVKAYLNNGRAPFITKIGIGNNRKNSSGKGNKKTENDQQENKKGNSEEQNDIEKHMKYKGIGLFKKNKLVGQIGEEDILYVKLVYGNTDFPGGVIPYMENGRYMWASIGFIKSRLNIKPYLSKGEPSINVELDLHYFLRQIHLNKALDTQQVDKLNMATSEHMKKNAEAVIQKIQKEFKTDIFGFGESIYRKYPKYWKTHQDNWDEIYPKIPIRIKVNARLLNTEDIINNMDYISKRKD